MALAWCKFMFSKNICFLKIYVYVLVSATRFVEEESAEKKKEINLAGSPTGLALHQNSIH